jgi:hypothetical protein
LNEKSVAKSRDYADGGRFVVVSPPNCNVGEVASRRYGSLKNPDDLLVELADLLPKIDDSESNIRLNSGSMAYYDGRIRF